MSNLSRKCVWVLSDNSHCNKPTSYIMTWDGGEVGAPKVRQYEYFCTVHQARKNQNDEHEEN